MKRLVIALVPLLGLAASHAVAAEGTDFTKLSADAQKIVTQVTDGKTADPAVCGEGPSKLRAAVISETRSLYFSDSLSGSPHAAGMAAGAYLKALCAK